MSKTTLSKAEYAQLTSKKRPSKMQPMADKKPQTEIKMLQNEVKALWEAHSHLLIELNRLKAEQNDSAH